MKSNYACMLWQKWTLRTRGSTKSTRIKENQEEQPLYSVTSARIETTATSWAIRTTVNVLVRGSIASFCSSPCLFLNLGKL